MLNIFYNPVYIKQKKVLLTRNFKHSIFLNYLINFNYVFNIPISEKYIVSGPHKRINNLVKTFKKDQNVSFNSIKYDNSYVVQYDEFGKSSVDKIINSNNPNKRILIGPLYNIEQDREINKLTKKYPYIKKLVATKMALKNAEELDPNFISESTIVLPSGIISEKDLSKNLDIKNRNSKCLIYFKKRPVEELNKVIEYLKSQNQKYEIFEYGKYENNKLKEAAKENSFAIIMSGTETQGFAIQELMAVNIPLIVWNKTINNYENYQLSGTSVPIWDKRCGVVIYNLDELKNIFNSFINNLSSYQPINLVLEKLTFEKYRKDLKNSFIW